MVNSNFEGLTWGIIKVDKIYTLFFICCYSTKFTFKICDVSLISY